MLFCLNPNSTEQELDVPLVIIAANQTKDQIKNGA